MEDARALAQETVQWFRDQWPGRPHDNAVLEAAEVVTVANDGIERWFKELTDRMLRRSIFTSVPALQTAILNWSAQWNNDPKPFVWKTTTEDIIEKVQRGRATLTRQINPTTDH